MTLEVASRNDYIGTGLVDTYAYGFKIFAAADLQIMIRNTDEVESELSYAADFDVTGVGEDGGGTITLTAGALDADFALTIRRVVDLTQQTDLRNQQALFPEVLEDTFDKLTMIDQQQQDAINRSIKMVVTASGGLAPTFPLPGAGKFIRWNTGGTSLEAVSAGPDDDTYIGSGFGAGARSWSAKVSDLLCVLDFTGVVGDGVTDCTAGIQRCIDFAILAGQKSIYFPAGVYKLTAALSIIYPLVLHGDGVGATFLLQTGAAADGVYFNYASYQVGGGLFDMSIHAGSLYNTATGSTGKALRVRKVNGGFTANRFDTQGFAQGVNIKECFYPSIHDFQTLYCQDAGVCLDSPGLGMASAGITISDGKLSNFGGTMNNTVSMGLKVLQAGGLYLTNLDLTVFNRGVVCAPSGGDSVLYVFCDGVLADTSVLTGWDFDGTSGAIAAVEMIGCWSAYSTNGIGVRVRGTVDDVSWIGGRIRENGKQGVSLESGTNVQFVGTRIAQNSKLADNTYDGVTVAAAMGNAQFVGCRIGNFSSGLTTTQANGIYVTAGYAASLQIVGNNLSNPGAGKSGVSNHATPEPLMVGNFPLQSGFNPPVNQIVQLTTVAAVAAFATTYLGVNAENATEAATAFRVARAGIITEMRFWSDTAPVGGETYIYTLRVNGVDTAITSITTGAATDSYSFGAVAVAEGAKLSVKLVVSGAAVATRHEGYLIVSN